MYIDIYKDNISYVTDEVSSVPINEANLNEENRIKFVTDLAAISRGKHGSANPAKRYKALLKEAAPMHKEVIKSQEDVNYKAKLSPSRPLEFIGVVLGYNYLECDPGYINIIDIHGDKLSKDNTILQLTIDEFNNTLGKYSYMANGAIYTNMRAVINTGITYDSIPYNSPDDLKEFKALRAMVPMFVWAQVPNTHTAISKEAQSDRVSENNKYWLPHDLTERITKYVEGYIRDLTKTTINTNIEELYSIIAISESDIGNGEPREAIVSYLLNISQVSVQHIFKLLGYKKEVYSRAMFYFKYKEFVITGWNIDPDVWEHLFIERNNIKEVHKNWTQHETEQFVGSIKEIIDNN